MQEETERALDSFCDDGFFPRPSSLVMANRRSSILKKPRILDLDATTEDREEPETRTFNRKVRFSSNYVKPFTTENNVTVWDTTYEEVICQSMNSVGSSGSNSLKTSQSSLTQNTCNIYVDPNESVEETCKPNFEITCVGEDLDVSEGNMDFTCVQKEVRLARNKTIVFDKSGGNMEFTGVLTEADKENLYFQKVLENPEEEVRAARNKTIVFDKSGGNMEFTEVLTEADKENLYFTTQNLCGTISFNPNDNEANADRTKRTVNPADPRRTILFAPNDNGADMELTEQITPIIGGLLVENRGGKIILSNPSDIEAGREHVVNPANSRKTILFAPNDNGADMEFTEQITPIIGGLLVENRGGKTILSNPSDIEAGREHVVNPANSRKTILFAPNDNGADMEFTEQITPIIGGLLVENRGGKTILSNPSDIEAGREHVVNPANSRKTILFAPNDNGADMDLTEQITPIIGGLLVENRGGKKILCNPSDIEAGRQHVVNPANSRKTILFAPNDNGADMELTEQITPIIGGLLVENRGGKTILSNPSDIEAGREHIVNPANSRKTILFAPNDNGADMELTEQIAPIIGGLLVENRGGNSRNTFPFNPSDEEHVVNPANSRKTILFAPSDNGADMELTQYVVNPSNTTGTIPFAPIDKEGDIEQIKPSGTEHVVNPANSRKTILFAPSDNGADMELTQHVVNPSNTILFAPSGEEGDMEQITPTTGNLLVANQGAIPRKFRRTILYNPNDNEADMDLTKSITHQETNSRLLGSSDNAADMEFTCKIKQDMKQNVGNSRKTIFFNPNDNEGNMEITAQLGDMEFTCKEAVELIQNVNVGNLRNTIFFNPDDNEGDIDITAQHNTDASGDMEFTCVVQQRVLENPEGNSEKSSKENEARINTSKTDIASKRVINEDVGMEFKPEAPKSTILLSNAKISTKTGEAAGKTFQDVSAKLRKALKPIDKNSKRKTIVFTENDDSMEFTECVKDLQVDKLEGEADMEFTEGIPTENEFGTRVNHEKKRKTMLFNPTEGEADMEITCASKFIPEVENSNDRGNKRKTIFFNGIDNNDDIEITQQTSSVINPQVTSNLKLKENIDVNIDSDHHFKHSFHSSKQKVNISGCKIIDDSTIAALAETDSPTMSNYEVDERIRDHSSDCVYLEKSNQFFDSDVNLENLTGQNTFGSPGLTSVDDTRNLLNFNSCGKSRSDFTKVLDGELEFQLDADLMPLRGDSSSFEIFPESADNTLNNDRIQTYNSIENEINTHNNKSIQSNITNTKNGSNRINIDNENSINRSFDDLNLMDRFSRLPDYREIERETLSLVDSFLESEETPQPDYKPPSMDDLLKLNGFSRYVSFDYKEPLYKTPADLKEKVGKFSRLCEEVIAASEAFMKHNFVRHEDEAHENSEASFKEVAEVHESLQELIAKTAKECNDDVCKILEITSTDEYYDSSTESFYRIETLYGTITITVKIDGDKGLIKTLEVNSEVPIKAMPIFKMVHRQFLEKLSTEKIHSAVGSTYTIFTLIDYLALQMAEFEKIALELRNLSIEYGIIIDEHFNIHFPIANKRLRLLCDIMISYSSYPCVTEDCIGIKLRRGRVNENHIKRLFNDCVKDSCFLRHFFVDVTEYLEGVKL